MRERERTAREPTHLTERKKEREERRGTGIAWHILRSRKKKTAEKEQTGRECVPGLFSGQEGEDTACRAKLGLELGGLSGSLPSGYSPTTHCSALLACLPAWLVQDPALSLKPPPFIYPQMPYFTPASPPPRSCLLSSTVPPLPWSCRSEDEREGEGQEERK